MKQRIYQEWSQVGETFYEVGYIIFVNESALAEKINGGSKHEKREGRSEWNEEFN